MKFARAASTLLRKVFSLMLVVALAVAALAGCAGKSTPAEAPQDSAAAIQTPAPEATPEPTEAPAEEPVVSFDDLEFTPWDVDAALQSTTEAIGEQDPRKYTILFFTDGADLESESGLASADIQEMIDSQFDSDQVNAVIFTGGTLKWTNELVPNDSDAIFTIQNGELIPLAEVGMFSMGNAGTLASYIDYAMKAFPAERYGIVLGDHGGGAIDGWGVDELFDSDGLTLREIRYALDRSSAKENKLEFFGFDACLMSTIESAVTLSDYANYLIASEDLEPGYGWDYTWLKTLSDNPDMDGAQIGADIVDRFIAFYENDGEDTTLSVTDLSKAKDVEQAMGNLLSACNADFSQATFKQFSKSRNNTKTFGGGSPRDNECDMIDLADMAAQLSEYYPDEADALINAIDQAVVHHGNSESNKGTYGLTAYYPFGGKDAAAASLAEYKAMGMDDQVTAYFSNFASVLTGETIAPLDVSDVTPQETSDGDYSIKLTQDELDNMLEIHFTVWEPIEDEPDYYYMLGENSNVEIAEDGTITTEFDGNWPGINGSLVCMFEISNANGSRKYAIPAKLNGQDVDLIALYNDANPDGKILGARPVENEDTDMAAKLLLPIKKGDKLMLYYYAEYFGDDESKETEIWYEGDEFTVGKDLKLEWLSVEPGKKYLYGFWLTDIQDNSYYTDFMEVEFN